jgi:hypothetical protein
MTAAAYPADYGYLRDTLGRDGDALDAMVCLTEPPSPGCLIPVKPVGLFEMRDEQGIDDKIICVPISDPNWSAVDTLDDLPQLRRQEIEQFFSIYKSLEGKAVAARRLALVRGGGRGDRGRPGAPARALTRGRSAVRAGERQLLALLDKRDVAPRVGAEIDRVVTGLAGEALRCTR